MQITFHYIIKSIQQKTYMEEINHNSVTWTGYCQDCRFSKKSTVTRHTTAIAPKEATSFKITQQNIKS